MNNIESIEQREEKLKQAGMVACRIAKLNSKQLSTISKVFL